MLSGPSEEAAWAEADASNPERESVASNPLELLGITGQLQTVCAPGKQEEEETPAGRRERAEEAGATGEEDEWLLQRSVKIQEQNGRGKRTESAPEGSTAPTVAREVHREFSSHASGEAWPTQVRPYYGLREKQGWLGGEVGRT
ncbi:hypothetical protein NDU88_005026 [Pleurodeles waltl]|uniref:Uncharacterized protein n=1 Tax=Pleurodeles waltl TaxID=8319 RepID=A0AAV7W8G8_PLEWA|nr:hypothetical protein NDU88_005026 [Pleurodeles waltl]